MLRASVLTLLLAAGLLAGCSQPEAPAPIVEAEPAPTPVEEAVDWTAMIGTGFCVQANAVATVSACGLSGPALTSPTAPASFEPMYIHDADGRDLAGGLLQLSWDAESPATQGLRVSAWIFEDCPDDCTVNRTIVSTSGVSPLSIPFDAIDLREGMAVAVAAMPADLTKGVAGSIGQEIHLTGTLSFVEDPDGDPEPVDDDEDE